MGLRLRGRAPYRIYAFRNIVSRSFPLLSAIPYNLLLDGQIACSHGVASSLYRDGAFPWKVSVAHNGVQIPDPLPPAADRMSLGAQPGELLLGMSAWFHPKRKGFDTAFRALALGLDRPFRLVLIGVAREHQEPARDLALACGLDPSRLIFPGYVEDVFPLYQALDIFLLPSREEGFSLSLLEAMGCGKPCIASRIPGNTEAIGHGVNGLLFKAGRPAELRKDLLRLAENPREAAELGQAARLRVLERHSIAHAAETLESILA
jgi:glycosyltransferase involved in cell wall biosynthesis